MANWSKSTISFSTSRWIDGVDNGYLSSTQNIPSKTTQIPVPKSELISRSYEYSITACTFGTDGVYGKYHTPLINRERPLTRGGIFDADGPKIPRFTWVTTTCNSFNAHDEHTEHQYSLGSRSRYGNGCNLSASPPIKKVIFALELWMTCFTSRISVGLSDAGCTPNVSAECKDIPVKSLLLPTYNFHYLRRVPFASFSLKTDVMHKTMPGGTSHTPPSFV